MPKHPMMCPNKDCSKYQQRTRLLGGCDCGTQLVPFSRYAEPSIEQLSNFAAVLTRAAGVFVTRQQARSILEADSACRESWLHKHREYQEAADKLPDNIPAPL